MNDYDAIEGIAIEVAKLTELFSQKAWITLINEMNYNVFYNSEHHIVLESYFDKYDTRIKKSFICESTTEATLLAASLYQEYKQSQ